MQTMPATTSHAKLMDPKVGGCIDRIHAKVWRSALPQPARRALCSAATDTRRPPPAAQIAKFTPEFNAYVSQTSSSHSQLQKDQDKAIQEGEGASRRRRRCCCCADRAPLTTRHPAAAPRRASRGDDGEGERDLGGGGGDPRAHGGALRAAASRRRSPPLAAAGCRRWLPPLLLTTLPAAPADREGGDRGRAAGPRRAARARAADARQDPGGQGGQGAGGAAA